MQDKNTKPMIIAIGVVVVVIVVFLAVIFIQSNNSKSSSNSSNSSSSQVSSNVISNNIAFKTESVEIQNMMFSPKTLTIKKGNSVTWTNSDTISHTVTSDTGAFESGTMTNGKTFSFTFNEAGTFTYHCNFHPNMTGTIVVQ
jgi:plastocyanin